MVGKHSLTNLFTLAQCLDLLRSEFVDRRKASLIEITHRLLVDDARFKKPGGGFMNCGGSFAPIPLVSFYNFTSSISALSSRLPN
jgi:hypothetical protein